MKLHSILLWIVCLFFVFVGAVSAHGDEPRVEIGAERLNPGAVLDLRGVDFEFEEAVDLALVGTAGEVSLGTVLADTEGIFLLTVVLPPDLAPGAYVVRATTDDHVVESPVITVWGTAVLAGGEEGLRDEDDGLLAPMPTFAPAQPAAGAPTAAPQEAVPPAGTTIFPVIWIAAGLGLAFVAGLLLRRKH